jgi:hypothetical protein
LYTEENVSDFIQIVRVRWISLDTGLILLTECVERYQLAPGGEGEEN